MTAVRLINTFILRQRMREEDQLIFPSMSGKLYVKVVSYIHMNGSYTILSRIF